MESPCRNLCQLDEQDICIGCGRSLAEIAAWSDFSASERATIMRRLAEEYPVDAPLYLPAQP